MENTNKQYILDYLESLKKPYKQVAEALLLTTGCDEDRKVIDDLLLQHFDTYRSFISALMERDETGDLPKNCSRASSEPGIIGLMVRNYDQGEFENSIKRKADWQNSRSVLDFGPDDYFHQVTSGLPSHIGVEMFHLPAGGFDTRLKYPISISAGPDRRGRIKKLLGYTPEPGIHESTVVDKGMDFVGLLAYNSGEMWIPRHSRTEDALDMTPDELAYFKRYQIREKELEVSRLQRKVRILSGICKIGFITVAAAGGYFIMEKPAAPEMLMHEEKVNATPSDSASTAVIQSQTEVSENGFVSLPQLGTQKSEGTDDVKSDLPVSSVGISESAQQATTDADTLKVYAEALVKKMKTVNEVMLNHSNLCDFQVEENGKIQIRVLSQSIGDPIDFYRDSEKFKSALDERLRVARFWITVFREKGQLIDLVKCADHAQFLQALASGPCAGWKVTENNFEKDGNAFAVSSSLDVNVHLIKGEAAPIQDDFAALGALLGLNITRSVRDQLETAQKTIAVLEQNLEAVRAQNLSPQLVKENDRLKKQVDVLESTVREASDALLSLKSARANSERILKIFDDIAVPTDEIDISNFQTQVEVFCAGEGIEAPILRGFVEAEMQGVSDIGQSEVQRVYNATKRAVSRIFIGELAKRGKH